MLRLFVNLFQTAQPRLPNKLLTVRSWLGGALIGEQGDDLFLCSGQPVLRSSPLLGLGFEPSAQIIDLFAGLADSQFGRFQAGGQQDHLACAWLAIARGMSMAAVHPRPRSASV